MTLEVALLFLAAGVLVFVVYALIQHALKLGATKANVKETMDNLPYRDSFEEEIPMNIPPAMQPAGKPKSQTPTSEPSQIREVVTEEQQMPEVPGQPEDELKEPEPLQRRVSQKVDEPSNYDKFEKGDNQAMFGSNLRHPEAMITKTDGFATLELDVASQIASNVKKPEAVNDLPYNAEMAQNGGEFMKGISAFDTSEGSSWFSNL